MVRQQAVNKNLSFSKFKKKTATSNKYSLTLKTAAKIFKFELGFGDKMPSEVVERSKSEKQWTWYENWVDVVFC